MEMGQGWLTRESTEGEKDMVSRGFPGAGGCAGCSAGRSGTLSFLTAEGSVTCVWKQSLLQNDGSIQPAYFKIMWSC